MKRKTLTMVLCLLTVLSVVGVGFASWVINDGDEEVRNGNIVVDTVNDERLELVVTPLQNVGQAHNTALNINFTAPEGYSNTDKWLQSNSVIYENLSVSFSCTVTKKNGGTFTDASDIDFTLTFVEPDLTKEQQKVEDGNPVVDGENNPVMETVDTAYKIAKTNNCFALATSMDGMTKDEDGVFYSDLVVSQDNKSITFTVTVKYVWGTIFGSVNPFNFYAGKDKASTKCNQLVGDITIDEATWGDHAAYYLGLLEDIANSASYSLTIQVSPKL